MKTSHPKREWDPARDVTRASSGTGKRWSEAAETFIWTDGNGDGAPDAGH